MMRVRRRGANHKNTREKFMNNLQADLGINFNPDRNNDPHWPAAVYTYLTVYRPRLKRAGIRENNFINQIIAANNDTFPQDGNVSLDNYYNGYTWNWDPQSSWGGPWIQMSPIINTRRFALAETITEADIFSLIPPGDNLVRNFGTGDNVIFSEAADDQLIVAVQFVYRSNNGFMQYLGFWTRKISDIIEKDTNEENVNRYDHSTLKGAAFNNRFYALSVSGDYWSAKFEDSDSYPGTPKILRPLPKDNDMQILTWKARPGYALAGIFHSCAYGTNANGNHQKNITTLQFAEANVENARHNVMSDVENSAKQTVYFSPAYGWGGVKVSDVTKPESNPYYNGTGGLNVTVNYINRQQGNVNPNGYYAFQYIPNMFITGISVYISQYGENAGLWGFPKIKFRNLPYVAAITGVTSAPWKCCDPTAYALLDRTQQNACRRSYGATDGNLCKNKMLEHCAVNPGASECREFCARSQNNCDQMLQKYCTDLKTNDPTEYQNDLKSTTSICACHQDPQVYADWNKELSRMLGVEINRTPECSYPNCNHQFYRYSYKNSTPNCSDIKTCINNVNISAANAIIKGGIRVDPTIQCDMSNNPNNSGSNSNNSGSNSNNSGSNSNNSGSNSFTNNVSAFLTENYITIIIVVIAITVISGGVLILTRRKNNTYDVPQNDMQFQQMPFIDTTPPYMGYNGVGIY